MKSNLLLGWEGIWRYPALLTHVARGAEVDPAQGVRSILHGIAVSHSRGSALNELLRSGEFEAGGLLIGNLKGHGSLGVSELEEMESRLAEARRRALDKIDVRQFELGTRALRCGLDARPPEDLSVAYKCLGSAEEILDLWEYEVEAAEEKRRQDFRTRLSQALAGRHELTPEWERAVLACIEGGRFQAAERLLEKGSVAGTSLDPAAVPRRPVWPYVDGTRAGLRRFLPQGGGEGKDHRSEWGPAPDDEAAKEVLLTLRPLAIPGTEVLADDVEKFVTALDRFLGAPGLDHDVRHWPGGLSTALFSLREPRVPRLAMCERGVRFWLPRRQQSAVPEQLLDTPSVIGFHPDIDLQGDHKLLTFNSSLLFRLVGDKNPRINFIRWTARQIPPEDMMPVSFDPSFIPEFEGEDDAYQYTAWFFDYHGFSLSSQSVASLIGFYSAQSRHVLCALLREICSKLRSRDEIISSSHVHAAWTSAQFRERATAHILRHVAGDPWLLAILACVYLAGDDEGGVSADYIVEWLLTYSPALENDVAPALRTLIEYGLLSPGADDISIMIPRSTRTLLVKEHMGDLDQFIRSQLSPTSI